MSAGENFKDVSRERRFEFLCQGEGSGDPAELGAAARIPKGGKHPGLNDSWDFGATVTQKSLWLLLGQGSSAETAKHRFHCGDIVLFPDCV